MLIEKTLSDKGNNFTCSIEQFYTFEISTAVFWTT